MEQQKQILYDFQLLSLQNGKPGFSTTTDMIVRSGQIPPYNPSMSNEQIAEYISDYIIKNWNQSDIQKAVNDVQNAIPGLEGQKKTRDEKTNIKNILYKYFLLIDECVYFYKNYISERYYGLNLEQMTKNQNKTLETNPKIIEYKRYINEKFGFPITTAIYTRGWPSGVLPIHRERWWDNNSEPNGYRGTIIKPASKEQIAQGYANHIMQYWNENDINKAYNKAINNISLLEEIEKNKEKMYKNSLQGRIKTKNISEQVREDAEIEHQNFMNERLIQNRCKNCNRQRFGRFDTCCQACLSGSHTADCDKRNRITTPYYMKKGGKRKGRKTHKKRTRKNKSRKFRK